MTRTEIGSSAPFFIVNDVSQTLGFYRDKLGFDVMFAVPPDDVFLGGVGRGAATFMFKAIGVEPVPNHTRNVKKGLAKWDAYVHVPDPDALAAEYATRGVQFSGPLGDNNDGLRGFEVTDVNGYVLYFGRPK
jgi:hypothetical protein